MSMEEQREVVFKSLELHDDIMDIITERLGFVELQSRLQDA